MALVHIFCFVFSLRLGAILIGAVTLGSSGIFSIFLLLSLDHTGDFSSGLQKTFSTNKFLIFLFENIHFFEELSSYVVGLAIFYSLMAISSILLLIAAYQCKPTLVYQFLCFYIIYIILACFYLLIFYLCVITDKDPLGTILYFSMAFLLLLFWIYTWVCIYCLTQIIKEVRRRLIRQMNKTPKYYVKKITQ